MSSFVEISWSAASIDEARMVSRYLVQEKLVACAQIIPWIESIYVWNNQLETAQETKVLLKTDRKHVADIEEIIRKNSSYQVPEILVRGIEGGNAAFLAWMGETLSFSIQEKN